MKAHIVLGLGFGDEGKGVTVNSLISSLDTKSIIVIRFSGGAQAGHTVMHNNVKHVHSSFGSGTLQGLPTYLTEHYLLDPQAMLTEQLVLEAKGVKIPPIFIHPLAKIVTPFDIRSNRANPKTLDNGSCGMGIGATMHRNLEPYKLYAKDLKHPEICRLKLEAIAYQYYNVYQVPEIQLIIDSFIKELKALEYTIVPYGFLKNFGTLIFEGSQGIMLDMEHGIFPNVTYAHTTSKNALEVCETLRIKEVTKYYVTRAYQTRHGNGWMSDERLTWLKNTQEETNVTGKWQGDFRVGKLDYDLLNYALTTDAAYHHPLIKEKHHLVVTCLDQVDTRFNSSNLAFSEYYPCSSPEGFDI